MEQIKIAKGWCGWCVVILIAILLLFAILISTESKGKTLNAAPPVPGPPGPVVQKYGDALRIAMQFFDIQKAGKLVDNKIPWRGDSALEDGKEAKLDLSKGMYVGGDNVKYGFPMAFTATILSWAILEYGDQMDKVDMLKPAQDSVKWITDYLVNAHPAPATLYVQVGDADAAHKCWDRPEQMTGARPIAQLNASAGGADAVAETAAALAAASLVFRSIDSNYSDQLVKHAKELFDFGKSVPGLYTNVVNQMKSYYTSSDYGDEMLWASAWLYHATGNRTYLDFVIWDYGFYYGNWGRPSWFSSDNKLGGVNVLLSRLFLFKKDDNAAQKLNSYYRSAQISMCTYLPNTTRSSPDRTNSGLIWFKEQNSLHDAMAIAFLATIFSDYMLSSQTLNFYCNDDPHYPSELRDFARSQVDYALGANPMGMSYVVGYGDKYPKFVYHRGASIPANAVTTCLDGIKWRDSPNPNPNVATGGLVGGPFRNETYIDSRSNTLEAEPLIHNTALLVGVLSSLVTSSSVVTSFGVA